MDKYDWLELATRVLGLWFVAGGIIAVLVLIDVRIATARMPLEMAVGGSGAFSAVGTSFLGTCMLLLAPGFVGWLRAKDARARRPLGGESSGASERPSGETV